MNYAIAEHESRIQKSFSDYLRFIKHANKRSEELRIKKRYLLRDIEEYARHYFNAYGRPFVYKAFADSIYPGNSSVIRHFISRHYKTFHNFLVESGLYDIPMRRYSTKSMVSDAEDLPIIFSASDIEWLPDIPIPDLGKVGKASGILYASSMPESENRIKGNLINYIRIKLTPYEMVYLEKHVIPLFASLFNVPNNFFFPPADRTRYVKGFKVREPQLGIVSLMFGTFFQNVMGIYSVRNGHVVKTKPKYVDIDKKGFANGILDCKSPIGHHQINFRGSKELLEILADFSGLSFSEIKPAHDIRHELFMIERTGKNAICESERNSHVGSNVLDLENNVIGKVTGHLRGGEWEKEGKYHIRIRLYSEPPDRMFQKTSYVMQLLGGQNAVRKVVEERISNPYRVLLFLERTGRLQKGAARMRDAQEYTYDRWEEVRDVNKLTDLLYREFPLVRPWCS